MKKKSRKDKYIKFILVSFLILSISVSIATYMSKQYMYDQLKVEEEKYLKEISELKDKLNLYEKELKEATSREYIERYARENLKMVSPDEIYYDVKYPDDK